MEMWAKRVEEWRASGLKAKAFCEERGFAVQTLYRWSARLSAPGCEHPAGPVRLARVVRRSKPEVARTSAPGGAVWVEVDGARIIVPPGVEGTTLIAVLAAVKATASGGAR